MTVPPATFELPRRPRGALAEFGPRYAAAERMARRYATAVAVVDGHPRERDELAAVGPTVLTLLDKVGRMCVLGAGTPAKGARSRGRRTKKTQTRARRLHDVHLTLLVLEKAVDAAVAMAVTVVLAADEPEPSRRRAEVDEWLAALTAALSELAD